MAPPTDGRTEPRIRRNGTKAVRAVRAIRGSRRPWIRPRRAFADDEAGSFVVLEAVLVALLVLTAILFFTSVQRPSTGTDQGGIDLAQVSADTLSILQTRTFEGEDFDEWVTSLARGDTAMADEVDDFITEILPTGARYSLRIDNGVSTLALLPHDAVSDPHAARAAQVMFLPSWIYHAAETNADPADWDGAAPGQTFTATSNPTLSRFNDPTEIKCIKSPIGATGILAADSAFAAAGTIGPGGVSWVSRWQSVSARGDRTNDDTLVTDMAAADVARIDVGTTVTAPDIPSGTTVAAIESATSIRLSAAAESSGKSAMLFTRNRVPSGAMYGTWAGYTDPGCMAGEVFVKVWDPRFRTVTNAQTTSGSTTLTVPAPSIGFSTLDRGLPVIGPGIPDNTRIVTVVDSGLSTLASTAILSAPATATDSGLTMQLPVYSPHAPYALQLVVWFGA